MTEWSMRVSIWGVPQFKIHLQPMHTDMCLRLWKFYMSDYIWEWLPRKGVARAAWQEVGMGVNR